MNFFRPAFLLGLVAPLTACAATPPLRFDFGSGPVAPGSTQITPGSTYSAALGYGLLSSPDTVRSSSGPGPDPVRSDALVSARPFSFLIDLPPGNYDVTVLLGDPAAAAQTTVKAETRRLMVGPLATASGTLESRTFTVNVRTPDIPGGGRVSLKPREFETFHWDDKLILEFNGSPAAVAGLAIQRNDDAVTVFLAGDSTVTDQPGEPWASWGQMLPRFFPAGIAVANHAESGLSLASFRGQRRLDQVLAFLKKGDYVFIQFGHNDQKEKGEGVGAFTTYADSLRHYVNTIRAQGGHPVLVTSMYRRRFNAGGLYDTLGDFPAAVRQVAAESGAPLIDLHAMSARLFSALGEGPSKLAFVHYPAGTHGADKDVKDDTHFSSYGAYELARCIVEGIRTEVPDLAARLAPDAGHFDPGHPDDPATFPIPPSPPRGEVRIPDGDGR